MDAIWVCEQSARELGYKEDTIPWKIYYRKEVYCPSDEFHMDISWTDFAYKFVVNNIKTRVSTKLKKVSKISNINISSYIDSLICLQNYFSVVMHYIFIIHNNYDIEVQ